MAKKKGISPVLLLALAGGGYYLFSQKQGGTAQQPNERWFDVPGYGPTPESALPQLGYVYFSGRGWYHQNTLRDAGWSYNQQLRQWVPPQTWGALEWVSLGGNLLQMAGDMGGQFVGG